jgi:hypothetical protein
VSKKKLIKSSKVRWVCKECGEDSKICKHLERDLAKLNSVGCVSALPVPNIENLSDGLPTVNTYDTDALNMEHKLRSYGLPDLYVKVTVAKMVYGRSLADIADEFSIPSRYAVNYIWQRTKELLRERGYK